jgi:hypothetical protein
LFYAKPREHVPPHLASTLALYRCKLSEKAGALGYLLKDSKPADLLQAIQQVHRGEPSFHHHHLFCMRCHALIDISRDFKGLELSQETGGYRIVKSQVTFYGYCPDCQDS